VVSALINVTCVIRHSAIREVSSYISVYIVVSALMYVMFVIEHSVIRAI